MRASTIAALWASHSIEAGQLFRPVRKGRPAGAERLRGTDVAALVGGRNTLTPAARAFRAVSSVLLDERADRRSQFSQPEGLGEKRTAGHLGRDHLIGMSADQQRWDAKL